MKKISLLIALLILTFSFIKAQEPSDLALYHFTIRLSEEFQSEILTLEEMGEEVKDVVEGRPHYLEYILEPYYLDVEERLQKGTDLSILPPESFGDWALYPPLTKRRAMKAVKADYYARIDVVIKPALFSSTSNTKIGPWEKEKKKIRPQVVAKLVLFDKKGKKVNAYKGKATSKEKIVLSKKVFNRWFRLDEDQTLSDNHNLNILDKVVYQAIDNLIEEVRASGF